MSNPFTAELDAALAYIKEQHASSDFVAHSEAKLGCKISMKTLPGATLPITRGDIVFPAGFQPQEIVTFLRDVENRKKWDGRFESATVVEMWGEEEGLIHSLQKGQWPVIRDFTVAFKVFREGDVTYFIQTSVVDSRLGEVKGRVRGKVTAGWVIKPNAAGDGSLDVSYIVNADPAGTLPAALIKMVSAETPACAGNVLELMQKNKK
ncbi:hypothetical protein HK101_007713 [Irineochytrium annulatum]|nr:hypothetical protein HK101_007713 [Irineochytrium annulatum]